MTRGRSSLVIAWCALAGVLAPTLPASATGVAAHPAGVGTRNSPTVPTATRLGLRASATTVGYGATPRLTVALTRAGDGAPVGGARVELSARRPGATTWSRIGSVTTSSAGTAALLVRPNGHTEYVARHAGSATTAASTSGVARVSVRFALTAGFRAPEAAVGHSATLSGTVAPVSRAGTALHLQRLDAGRWVTVGTRRLAGTGGFSFAVARPTRGLHSYRVWVPGRGYVAGSLATARVAFVSVHTYVVETRGRIVVDVDDFASGVAATYAEARGWRAAYRRFARVASGGAFSVVLAEASQVPSYSPICSATYSCRVGRYVVINQDRWRYATPGYLRAGGTLASYRLMVVNHETGHWLGRGHASCPGVGRLAPVMMQQSKGLGSCRPNPWPLPDEIAAVR